MVTHGLQTSCPPKVPDVPYTSKPRSLLAGPYLERRVKQWDVCMFFSNGGSFAPIAISRSHGLVRECQNLMRELKPRSPGGVLQRRDAVRNTRHQGRLILHPGGIVHPPVEPGVVGPRQGPEWHPKVKPDNTRFCGARFAW